MNGPGLSQFCILNHFSCICVTFASHLSGRPPQSKLFPYKSFYQMQNVITENHIRWFSASLKSGVLHFQDTSTPLVTVTATCNLRKLLLFVSFFFLR